MPAPNIPGRVAPSRRLSLGFVLSLLVAGTMLPLLLFAVGLIYFYQERSREEAFDRVLQVTRNIRLTLDAETQNIVSALEVLALSQALRHDDFEGFRRDAEAFASRFPAESAILLADRRGRQIINTRVPTGTSLPPRRNLEGTEQVFATGKPVFSHFFTASIANTRIITIDVPVMRDGAVVYVISFNPPLSTFQHIIETQSPGPDWTISIFDQRGINFARVPNPEQMVGQQASPTLFSEMFKANEAKIETVSLEGVPLLTAYSHSPLSGWIVAAGVATRTLTAPLWRTLAMTVGIGAVLLATGMYFAISMAARISRAETLHELLVAELNHRAKNTLATVQSIAMQTFQPNVDLAEARRKFTDRVAALGRANTLLGEEKWVGADVRSIAESVLEPYSNDGRVQIKGPQLRLPAAEALTLSMILHELATNAAKYGALSNTAGRVRIEWEGNSERFTLIWREEAGPPVQRPQREGFGSYLITSGLAAYGGSAVTTYNEGGLVCVITCQSRKQG